MFLPSLCPLLHSCVSCITPAFICAWKSFSVLSFLSYENECFLPQKDPAPILSSDCNSWVNKKTSWGLSYIAVSEPLTKVPDKWAGHKNVRVGAPQGDKELATDHSLSQSGWKTRGESLNKGQYISHFFSCLFSVVPSFLGLLWEFCRAH